MLLNFLNGLTCSDSLAKRMMATVAKKTAKASRHLALTIVAGPISLERVDLGGSGSRVSALNPDEGEGHGLSCEDPTTCSM